MIVLFGLVETHQCTVVSDEQILHQRRAQVAIAKVDVLPVDGDLSMSEGNHTGTNESRERI